MRFVELGRGTWLEVEEAAYPHGRMSRRGLAVWPDGKTRTVFGGIPDSFFSIPAWGKIKGRYVRGFLTVEGNDTQSWWQFHCLDKYKELCGD